MSLFAELLTDAGWPLLFETNGTPVDYVDREGEETPITLAIVGNAMSRESRSEGKTVVITTRQVTLMADPASSYGGVANPQENACIKIDGVLWPIKHRDSDGNGVHRLVVERTEAQELTRNGYRGS